jgi:4-amino-4-deoxy-L-arabinose transferase-like glycosyltransferase
MPGSGIVTCDMTTRAEPLPGAESTTQAGAELARFWPLLVLLMMLPVWSIGMFYRAAWTPDEPREYDIAYNMLRSGDLVTPRLAGEPFLEKPPLSYWAQSTSMRAFGPSIAAARLPNLLWAALTALCVGLLASDLAAERRRNQAALIAALACGTMVLVLQTQIWLATDAPMIAATAAALLCTWRLARAGSWQQQLSWSVLLGASLAGAFLAKNGFGLLVPGLTIVAWFTWERRLLHLLRWPWWLAAGVFALFTGGWLLALGQQPGGGDLLHALLSDNLLARFLPVKSNASYDLGHRSSHWKFLLLLPIYVLPWTFAVLGASRWGVAHARRVTEMTSAVRFCLACVVPACLFLLVSRTARDIYFAPALLCMPVLLALWLTSQSDTFTGFERSLLRLTRYTMYVLAAVFGAVAVGVLLLTGIHEISIVAFVALIALVIAGTRLSSRASPPAAHSVIAATGTFLLAFGTFEVVAFPTLNRAEDLDALGVAAGPQLRNGRVALYCGDETIRATLDYAVDLRPQNVCTKQAAQQLLQDHPDQQFLVLLAAPRSAQRMGELFPSLDTTRWESKAPRAVQRVTDLTDLGLQPTARWSSPGGRAYALYGHAPSR